MIPVQLHRWIFFLGLAFIFLSCEKGNDQTNVEKTSQMPDMAQSDTANYKVTFIELGSVNCIPCKMMVPIMEEIEKEYAGQVKVIFHDVWTEKGKPFGKKHGIKLIPTQIFLDKDGNEYFRHEGFFPKEDLMNVLKQQDVR